MSARMIPGLLLGVAIAHPAALAACPLEAAAAAPYRTLKWSLEYSTGGSITPGAPAGMVVDPSLWPLLERILGYTGLEVVGKSQSADLELRIVVDVTLMGARYRPEGRSGGEQFFFTGAALAGKVTLRSRSDRLMEEPFDLTEGVKPPDKLRGVVAHTESRPFIEELRKNCCKRDILRGVFLTLPIVRPGDIEALVNATKDTDPDVRWAALGALVSVKGAPLEQIARAMGGADRGTKAALLRRVDTSDVRGVELLVASLADPDAADIAQDALRHVSDPRMVQPLFGLLVSTDPALRTLGEKILLNWNKGLVAGDVLVSGLTDARPEVRRLAVGSLADMPEPRRVDLLLPALQDPDSVVRIRAATLLARSADPRVVEPLTAALQDADPGVRRQAALGLGTRRGGNAGGSLLAGLQDPDPGVRAAAVAALGKQGGADAVDPLIAALTDGDVSVRRAAAHALGTLKDLRSVDPLIAAVRDGDPTVRLNAVASLSRVRDARVLPALRAVLSDSDPRMRRQAVAALARLDDTNVVEVLIGALSDPEHSVRVEIGDLLIKRNVKDERLLAPILEVLGNPKLAFRGAMILGPLGDARAVEPLMRALEAAGSDSTTQSALAGALGDLRAGVAVDRLMPMLKGGSAPAAADALGKIGDPRAIEPLRTLLLTTDNLFYKEWAAKALAQFDDPRALAALETAVERTRKGSEIRETLTQVIATRKKKR